MLASCILATVLLSTPRFILRPPNDEDVDAMCEVFCVPEVMRFIGDGAVLSRDQVKGVLQRSRESIEACGLGAFVVVDNASGVVCGDCILPKIPRSGSGWRETGLRGPDVEVGYRLAKRWWNQGVATEAASRILQYAFDPKGPALQRVVAVTHPENIASQRVLEKLGMKHRGMTDLYYDQSCELFELLR